MPLSGEKTMSYDDYLKVVAILHVAHEHMKKVNEYQDALAPLIGEEADSANYAGDAIWQPYTADELLKRVGYTVAPIAEATNGQ